MFLTHIEPTVNSAKESFQKIEIKIDFKIYNILDNLQYEFNDITQASLIMLPPLLPKSEEKIFDI